MPIAPVWRARSPVRYDTGAVRRRRGTRPVPYEAAGVRHRQGTLQVRHDLESFIRESEVTMAGRRGFPTSIVGPLLLFLLTGCGNSILGTDPDTGLDVEVRKGPIDPVARPGEDNSAPVEDARVRIRRIDGDGKLRVHTDADGRARVPLGPGTYEITVEACPGALGLPEPATAEVRSGETTPVRLVCDTGIR